MARSVARPRLCNEQKLDLVRAAVVKAQVRQHSVRRGCEVGVVQEGAQVCGSRRVPRREGWGRRVGAGTREVGGCAVEEEEEEQRWQGSKQVREGDGCGDEGAGVL